MEVVKSYAKHEKDNLEDLVSKNPTYFYDILPYTYVFEMISISPPSWYDSSTAFNVSIFRTLCTIQ